MAFVHCHTCGWSQDDFWDKDYSPLHGSHFEWLRDKLMDAILDPEKRLLEFGNEFIDDHPDCPYQIKDESTPQCKKISVLIDYRDLLADALEHKARTIRNMRWVNSSEMSRNSRCPKCGSELCID